MTLWAADTVHADCARHAYGSVAQYFEQHECRSAARYVWTMPYRGRQVAMTVESVVAADGDPDGDVFEFSTRLARLENSAGTGSIDDLLREAAAQLPAGPQQIPKNEAFDVEDQDAVVGVFDAWYVRGTTASQDASLLTLEASLFPSAASEPAAPTGSAGSVSPAPAASGQCTRTSEGHCIEDGQYCEDAERGRTGHDGDGRALRCALDPDDNRLHWHAE